MEKARFTINFMAAFLAQSEMFSSLYLIPHNNFFPQFLPSFDFEEYRDSTSWTVSALSCWLHSRCTLRIA